MFEQIKNSENRIVHLLEDLQTGGGVKKSSSMVRDIVGMKH